MLTDDRVTEIRETRAETDKAALLDLLAETERELIEAQEKLEESWDQLTVVQSDHRDEVDQLKRHLRYLCKRLSDLERRVEGRTRYSSGLRAARVAIDWSPDGIDSGEWDGEPL